LPYATPALPTKHPFIKGIGGLLCVSISVSTLIFLPSWTFNYWQAWVFLAVFMVSISAIFIYLARNDPSLLARRVKTTEKAKNQKIIRSLLNLTFAAVFVVSSLDHRFAWSAIPAQIVFLGDALVAIGLLLIFFVFKENSFAAQTVEVEAKQTVISTGPYAIVRHPMYVGGLVFISGIPIALSSWWGLLMAALIAPVIAWRLLDEERLLTMDLMGYAEYRNKAKYRLIPFVW
jgi:protein-S-isoprenylcysteine O-methyltransferase Ste14